MIWFLTPSDFSKLADLPLLFEYLIALIRFCLNKSYLD
jgi:hypothetical protein